MGKSLRSKRMRQNRIRKRKVNRPKELKKLKEALSFEYNEQTENAHLSAFSDIVNGPLDNYFEPSKTILEKRQERYENFLSRKIPKIAEIASKNLVKPIGSPEKRKRDEAEDENETLEPVENIKAAEDISNENLTMDCSSAKVKPSKSGSWPVWMSQRKIREASKVRRKIIKRAVKREKRMSKSKYAQKKKKQSPQPSSENQESMET